MLKYIVEESVNIREDALKDLNYASEAFKCRIMKQPFFKFFYPTNVNFTKFLGSLYLLYDCIENVLYNDYMRCLSAELKIPHVENTNDVINILLHNSI